MKFSEISKNFDLNSIFVDERTEVYKSDLEGKKICIKVFLKEPLSKLKEELAYGFLEMIEGINIPKLIEVGDDYIITEFIEGKKPSLEKMINALARFHVQTTKQNKDLAFQLFREVDLSGKELFEILQDEKEIIEKYCDIVKLKKYMQTRFIQPNWKTLIHGDLTARNFIEDKKGNVYFIDLELLEMGNPWFDLAILPLEYNNKNIEFLNRINQIYLDSIQKVKGYKNIPLNWNKSFEYLESNLVLRTVYTIAWAHNKGKNETAVKSAKCLDLIL